MYVGINRLDLESVAVAKKVRLDDTPSLHKPHIFPDLPKEKES